MSVTLSTCSTCTGTGAIPHPKPGDVPCAVCAGHGVHRVGGRAFAGTTSAEAARRADRAVSCRACRATGRTTNPDTLACHGCCGTGTDLQTFAPGDTIPDAYGPLTRHTGPTAIAHYAATVTVTIRRHPRAALTRGAALLGLGTVWASTGTVPDDDHVLTAVVREHLARGVQLCHLADPATRCVTDIVTVLATPTGYAVTTTASLSRRAPWLPPTYTDDQLNAPYQ